MTAVHIPVFVLYKPESRPEFWAYVREDFPHCDGAILEDYDGAFDPERVMEHMFWLWMGRLHDREPRPFGATWMLGVRAQYVARFGGDVGEFAPAAAPHALPTGLPCPACGNPLVAVFAAQGQRDCVLCYEDDGTGGDP